VEQIPLNYQSLSSQNTNFNLNENMQEDIIQEIEVQPQVPRL
jgi:hypothetical protein